MKASDIELYNRLKSVLDYIGCNQNMSKIAKGLGINSQNISNIYHRQTIPKLNLIAKIAAKYPDKINYHWLLTGEGKMLSNRIVLNQTTGIYQLVNETPMHYQTKELTLCNDHLMALQEKDQTIIALQHELSQSNQKLIGLLESIVR